MGAILQTCVKHHVAEAATPPDLEIRIASVDRKSTRLNSSHLVISYAVFCLKKKKNLHSSAVSPTGDIASTSSWFASFIPPPPTTPSPAVVPKIQTSCVTSYHCISPLCSVCS